ncbi:MAG: hypothetical protein PHH13_00630 [Candidatus Peribacteraceae bacterium]|nr:hypothetical protein [Candidatus Peribacteraceae bacterium]
MANTQFSLLKITATAVLVAAVGAISTLGGGAVLAMLNACSYDDAMSMVPQFVMSTEPPILHAAAAEPICPSHIEGFLLIGVLLFAAGFLFHGFLRLSRTKHR